MTKGLFFFLVLGGMSAQTLPVDPLTTPDSVITPDSLIPSIDPLGWHGRWDSYLDKTYSWKRIGVVAAESTFDQMFSLHQCGRPPYCFHHEIEGALLRRTARTTVELAVGGLLHEDIRRRPSGLPGIRQRVTYALIHAPLARGRDGEWQPAYSRFAGTLGAVAVSSAWHGRPASDPRVYESIGWSFTSYFQDALWAEFEPDMKRMATRFGQRFRHHDPPIPTH